MNKPGEGLSDPGIAALAWARYWRLMRWMLLAAILAVAGALGWLYLEGGLFTIHMIIATAAGVGFSVLLASALMLLIFLSSGSGHDDSIGTIEDDQ